MTVFSYGTGAPDGYEIVVDTADAANGNVVLQSTVPSRTTATITKAGFGSVIAARQAAHALLKSSLPATGDCLALVQLERESHRDPELYDNLPMTLVRIAHEHAAFDSRESALT